MRCALVLALTFVACAGREAPPPEPGPGGYPDQRGPVAVPVRTYGSLQLLMEHGQLRPVVSLASLRHDKSLVGLGSLSALRGEIALLPGETWVSYPNDDGTSRANELGAADETAAFLVVASVANWQTVALPEDTSFDDLDDAVEKIGQSAGLNVDAPFPFLIEGSLANLEFNVADGRSFQDGAKIDRDVLRVASPKGKYPTVDGVIVGFFGNDEPPAFVHPDSRIHLHVVLRAERQVGHVDHVDLPRGVSFRVPAPTP